MITNEIWRPILGQLNYEVSNLGRIRSLKFQKIRLLKSQPCGNGYLKVRLSNNGVVTPLTIHQLVLESFVGRRPLGKVTRHLNGNPKDNRLVNLAWGTQSENMKDRGSGWKQLKPHQVKKIRKYLEEGYSQRWIANRLGTQQSTISKIKNGVHHVDTN